MTKQVLSLMRSAKNPKLSFESRLPKAVAEIMDAPMMAALSARSVLARNSLAMPA